MTAARKPQKIALTPREVAPLIGKTERRVQQMLVKGELPGVKVGHLWLIGKDALADFLNGRVGR